MGKAGKALKQVLEMYRISQNKLAVTMGINRSTVYQWFHEITDPSAESIADIITALEKLDEMAAREFLVLYLGKIPGEKDDEK